MKILMVCGAGRLYGKEMVTLSLIEGLKSREHEVACVTSSWNDGEFEKRLKKLSVAYSLVPLGFISRTLTWSAVRMTLVQAIKLPGLWWRYRKIIRSFQPDVVLHSNFHHVILLWPIFGDEINIFHVHDAFAPSEFHRNLFKLFKRRISTFVGVSNFVAGNLLQLGVPEEKVRYVLNGVSADTSPGAQDSSGSFAMRNSGMSNHSIRIGIIGQVDEWKGHEDLVDALHILEGKGHPFLCRIFGTGSPDFTDRLKAKIEHYGLSQRVEWMGFVHDHKSIYGQIDVCVVPSRIPEAFGMVVAEALIYGIPVVASRKGALPEIVLNDVTGYLVDAGAPEQIAEKICALADSPAKRNEIGKYGRKYGGSSLGAEKMIDHMESIFTELLQQRKRVA